MDEVPPMGAAEFAAQLNVSRETMDRLAEYEAMLRQWQRRINLVGKGTLVDVWRRHFLDSAQLCRHIPEGVTIADIGSGAGLPGLVLAIMRDAPVILIESDQRKAAFLREVARAANAPVDIRVGRAETLPATLVDVVTARAVAPLVKLLGLAQPWLKASGGCFFLKGSSLNEELTEARQIWDINYEVRPSLSDSTGKVLWIKEFRRV